MENIKEYIIVEKRAYEVLKFELYSLKKHEGVDNLLQKVKDEEGFVVFFKDLYPKEYVGFITTESIENRLRKFIVFFNRYEKLPNFIKYILEKKWKKQEKN